MPVIKQLPFFWPQFIPVPPSSLTSQARRSLICMSLLPSLSSVWPQGCQMFPHTTLDFPVSQKSLSHAIDQFNFDHLLVDSPDLQSWTLLSTIVCLLQVISLVTPLPGRKRERVWRHCYSKRIAIISIICHAHIRCTMQLYHQC